MSDELGSLQEAAKQVEIDNVLFEEVEIAQDLGTDVSESGFYATPGDQPIAFRLRDLYASATLPIPNELTLYKSYDLWVVPHRVSIIRRKGNAEVTAVGVEVEYDTGGNTCCVASLLPTHKFVDRGNLSFRVKIGGNGEASLADELSTAPPLAFPLAGRAGLSVQASAEGQAGFCFSAVVATPEIQAVGLGSSRCEWRFDLDTKFQFGQDIECWSIVILPRLRPEHGEVSGELKYRIRFYLNLRTLFLSTRRESDWKPLTCRLQADV